MCKVPLRPMTRHRVRREELRRRHLSRPRWVQSRRVCQTTGLQTQVPRTSEDGEPVRRRSFNNILEKAADFASERERESERYPKSGEQKPTQHVLAALGDRIHGCVLWSSGEA